MKPLFHIILFIASLLVVAGCLKDPGASDAGLITIEASIGAPTKVDYKGDGSAFAKGDQIAVYAWTGSASPVPDTRAVDGVVNTLGSGGWTPASLMRWKSMSSTHYFLGVSPVHAISSFTADPYTLNPDNYTASDLLVATTPSGITPSKSPVSLKFGHMMAKLVVNLTFRKQWSSTPTVTSVTVNAKKTGTVNYLAQEVTATGTAAAVALSATDNAKWSGLQVPQTGVKTITVQIGGKDYVYTHSSDIPLVGGRYITINLNVGRDKIELDKTGISITDWESGTPIEGETVQPGIPFALDAYFPADQLPGRSGWQNGDVMFVLCQVEGKSFVSNTEAKYLKMTHNGTAWSVAEMLNGTATPGCLGLANGDQVSMRAVYLPYGQDASVSADGEGGYAFGGHTYDCYLTATLGATVSGGTLSGCFDLSLPEGVMLFSIANNDNCSGLTELREPHLTPLSLSKIFASLEEDVNPVHGAPVQGHTYGSTSAGYAFYAAADAGLDNVLTDYHFTQVLNNQDYYGYSKRMALSGASSRVLALPALGSTDWQALVCQPIDLGFEMDDPVRGGKKRIYWASCNLGAAAPEESGDYFAWNVVVSKMFYGSWRLPTREEMLELKNNTTYLWTTEKGVDGGRFTASNGNSIFLPAAGYDNNSTSTLAGGGATGYYWSSSSVSSTGNQAYGMCVNTENVIAATNKNYAFTVRLVTD